ncbi:Gfo/Idh/MocA family protein [Calidithermus timidus]|jgi:predicted dehydrogenase|uniref:Gfo/Idh/MocA family protein n=1 Tax=Calidithermus timidus TaxID=307124 RepID=UPI0003684F87|nr:Gfo/Idh/MocA family oxidoreductase [Calidithermus timidus]
MRIGILSFAHLHAEGYQAHLKNMPGVELVGFSHENAEEARHFAHEYGLKWFPRHQDLLAEGLDGVIVCSENARHLELVELAAQAGCHVLCEKPIETSLADALAMRAACEANGVGFMTAFPMRFAPSVQAVRSAIQEGRLGRILGVNGINHSEIPRAHRAWFAERELAGGGAAMDHIVHLADLLRWYFDAEVTEVYAELDNLFYPGEVDVDTAGLLLVSLSNGVRASIDCSWSRPTWYPRWGHLKMEVVGEGGTMVLDAFAQHLTLYARHGSHPVSWVGFGPDPNRAMLGEFIASIREHRQPSVTWNDGFQALRVALAAYESSESCSVVVL